MVIDFDIVVQVLSQRNCLHIRGAASVGLFNFSGSSSIKVANRLHYCTRTSGVQDLPSSKRRSRGPVMAAKKGVGGMFCEALELLLAFLSRRLFFSLLPHSCEINFLPL